MDENLALGLSAGATLLAFALAALHLSRQGQPPPPGPPGPPGPPPPGGVGVSVANAQYGTAGGVSLLYDYYAPTGQVSGPVPLVVYVHGGDAGSADSKAKVQQGAAGLLLAALVGAGYGVAAINYRFGPGYPLPAEIQDVKLAVRYFRANAATLGIDPNRIGLWGTSLGGWRSALCAMTDDATSQSHGWVANGLSTVSSTVRAVIDWFGADDLALTIQLTQSPSKVANAFANFWPHGYTSTDEATYSATTYVTSASPPMIHCQGLSDVIQPYQVAQEMDSLLTQAGVPSTLVLVTNAGHGFSQVGSTPMSPSLAEIVADSLAFAQAYV